MILPAEFARMSAEIIAHHKRQPVELRQAWMHLAIQTLYENGFAEGVEAFERATAGEEGR